MDEKLYLSLTKFGSILTGLKDTSPKKRVGASNIS